MAATTAEVTMFARSISVDVNPFGTSPILTKEQLWKGIEQKAEDPRPFVPGMESSQVVERTEDGFIREVVVRGELFRERITLIPPVQIRFDRIQGRESGWITNTLSEGPHGLLLTYTIAIGFPGVWPGSDEEQRLGSVLASNYAQAIAGTLDTIRRMVAEGKVGA
jgi:hypothetical protein